MSALKLWNRYSACQAILPSQILEEVQCTTGNFAQLILTNEFCFQLKNGEKPKSVGEDALKTIKALEEKTSNLENMQNEKWLEMQKSVESNKIFFDDQVAKVKQCLTIMLKDIADAKNAQKVLQEDQNNGIKSVEGKGVFS